MKRYVCLTAAVAITLALSSSCAGENAPAPAATDWKSGVRTDWSQLTAYKAPEEIYSRLSAERMPELVPSGDYGPLLPYIGERTYGYDDGNLFGFVTMDGKIVTDAAYPLIGLADQGPKPVYRLIKSPGGDTEDGWRRADTYGVCAYDGSWATAYIYQGVLCLDEVILLVRDRKTNDADVLDYDGQHLYSLKDTAYFDRLLPGMFEEFFYGYGDGLLTVPLADGASGMIDERSGALVDTGFAQTGWFSEGLAPVSSGDDGTGPFGYIDRSFKVVIEPRFYEPQEFLDGKAVVRDKDGDYLIIDRTGAELLRAKGPVTRYGAGVFLVADGNGERWLDGDLKALALRPGFSGEVHALDSWYWYNDAEETILSDGRHEYALPGAVRVISVTGAFVEYRSSDNCDGVMTLDGTDIVKADDRYTGIWTVETKSGDIFFATNRSDNYSREYALLDTEGRTVTKGRGSIWYDGRAGLFQISADDFFGYCDGTGRFVFRISLMKWMPD
ncbi:WG containing repeat-containing protein [Sporobacter termitidis DSM 10068]|uniref:WG containing repeat-containing protein n=1 Tax=Sporobacter termitidis DSM 10068 TaxID=1123282 RepID=A0A1M5XRM6_9FIRM|nr:WG repeat-containing protein [Sporobacter termitidis]SHI02409.1 WG containing repeat-containing protein [Sporobacter termitidis DSM 10068]